MMILGNAVRVTLAALLLVIFIPVLADFQSASQSIRADTPSVSPALWKLEAKQGKQVSTVYLFGSVHFGKPSFYPLPTYVESAYQSADVLAVEVDITKVNPQTLLSYAALPADQTLKTVLDAQTYKQLQSYAQAQSIPITAFERFQPWFVGMQLIQVALMKSQYSAVNGLDMHLLMRQDKPVEEIESIDVQMQMFAGMSNKEQSAFLQQTLTDMSESDKYIGLMMTAWEEGDLDGLYQQIIAPMKSLPGGSALYKKVFTDRNRHMTDAIEHYLKSGKTVFYTVGLGHYAGKDSILAMLKQRGYKTERLK